MILSNMSIWEKYSMIRDFNFCYRCIDVWKVIISSYLKEFEQFWSILSDDEIIRAQKFVVSDAKESFVITRAILRVLIAKYLEIAPGDVYFEQNNYGKPYVNGVPLNFNVSHSRDISLLIFSRTQAVGVDIEFINHHLSFDNLAKRFFTDKENNYLSGLPMAERMKAFFDIWSCKEALIKVKGESLFKIISKFSIDLFSNNSCTNNVKHDFHDKNLYLQLIDLDENYVGAVAIENYAYDQKIRLIDF